MAKRTVNNIKLGAFVLAGLLLLIVTLYFVGKDTNLFGRNYKLRAHFDNVQGLSSGNNIRYAGIQVGTVQKVKIMNDTLIEVTMLIKEKMKAYIHKNDWVSMGTDGLMGNRLLNIIPARDGSPLAQQGDLLRTRKTVSTENMLETLDRTNRNVFEISEDLKQTIQRLNMSNALWNLLDDESLPQNLRASALAIRRASAQTNNMAITLSDMVNGVKEGKGSLGSLLKDTAISAHLSAAAAKINYVADEARATALHLHELVSQVQQDINQGEGAVPALLSDTALLQSLRSSLSNIEAGTASFSQNMEALKHNFLLRGYFRKQEKKRQKAAAARTDTLSPQ